MSILAYGLNYRTASLEFRERLAFPKEYLEHALQDVTQRVHGISEAAIISTCNRTEVYCATNSDNAHEVAQWLASTREVGLNELQDASYCYWDQDAAKHSIRVASGLDSQMIGEPQIMGQLKDAFATARLCGTIGPELNLLSRMTLQAAKQVRHQTDIGRNPISIAYAAVSLASQLFENLNNKHALLIGAGETIGLVAEHLLARNVASITVANRTLSNAQVLASKFGGKAIQLSGMADQLALFDMVISSTGSTLPVLGKGTVEAAIAQRKRKPIFMVDIAVPRDIEPGVGDLSDVYLYSIDDLTQIVENNKSRRLQAAQSAETLVAQGAVNYQREQRLQQDQKLIANLRQQAEAIRQRELSKALKQLEKTNDSAAAIEALSRALTNKLIHSPTVAMREASEDGRNDLVNYLSGVFSGDDEAQPESPDSPASEKED